MLNYGLDFEYNKNTREATIKNVTNKTIYDVEMLFRMSYDVFYTKCKYKKLNKIIAGETVKLNFKENDIKNIELMKYTTNDLKEHIKTFVLTYTSVFLYIAAFLFILFNSSSFIECISGLVFLTIFPLAILIMDLGARYDHRKSEEAYYKSSMAKPL